MCINSAERQRHPQASLALTRPLGPQTTNPILWQMSWHVHSERDPQKVALSSLFCFVFFSWLDPSPGSFHGILVDANSPWKQLARAWLASGLLSASGFPEPREKLALMVFLLVTGLCKILVSRTESGILKKHDI